MWKSFKKGFTEGSKTEEEDSKGSRVGIPDEPPLKTSSKPVVEFDFDRNSFVVGQTKKLTINLENKGTASAEDFSFEILDDEWAELKKISKNIERLDPGEKEYMVIYIKFKEAGQDIPFSYQINFRNALTYANDYVGNEEEIRVYDSINQIKNYAKEREEAHDYDSAIEIWESIGEIEEAVRVRKVIAKEELNPLGLPISSHIDYDQVVTLRELYEKTDMDIKEIFENYQIDNLYKLTKKEYEKLKKRLEDILKEEEAKDKAQFAEFLENAEKGDNQFQNFWGDQIIILDDRVELIIKEGSPTLEKNEFGNSKYDIGKTRIHYEGLKLSFSKKHKWIEFGQYNSWGKGNIHFKNLAKWERIEEMIYEAKKSYGKNPIQQTVIHGDYVDDRDTTYVDDRDTIVKDSVVNKSNIGAGGKSKAEELREAKALLDEGIIDDDEFNQMKKEILGK